MRQFQLNFWNEFKRIFCYHTGLRRVYEYRVTPWKQYDRLIDIPISEMKNIIKEEKIKTLIIDMDGTLKYYKKGLIKENKDWVSKIKKYVNVYVISNANKDLTSKVADELEVNYVYSAKKPKPYGFDKICKETNSTPDEVIVIGDAIRADIIGANKYGINKTILLKDLNLLGLNKGVNEYEKFYYNSFYFILFSFIGWIIETIYHFAKGIFVNRGFLTGPFCIIYGFSTLIILKLDEKIKIKNKILKAIVLWITIFITCSVFEYLTSYLIEMLFGIRLWDYSGLSYNINGRVRLITSVAWSNCGVVLIYLFKPFIDKIYLKLLNRKDKLFNIIHIVLWLMFIDWIISIIIH